MKNIVTNKINFPEFTGVNCLMMPFIQGDSSSLPNEYKSYSHIIDNNFIEKGEVGYLTIDESYVDKGESQRGYNSIGIDRNVHVEVGHVNGKFRWGGGSGNGWGGKESTLLDDDTEVLIANSIANTCKLWNTLDKSYTKDGDLSEYIENYPSDTGTLLDAGELAKISIFTPHECINQEEPGNRQFIRIVGNGVTGREEYFTTNPLLD